MRQKIKQFLDGIKSKLSRQKNDDEQNDFDEYYLVEEEESHLDGEEDGATSEHDDSAYDLSDDGKFNFANFKENLRHKFSLLLHKIKSRKTKELKVGDIDSDDELDETDEEGYKDDLVKNFFHTLSKRLKVQRIPEFIFSEKYRSNVHRGFLYAVAGVAAFAMAKNVALFIKGPDQTKLSPASKKINKNY